jgi:hypothetical protein
MNHTYLISLGLSSDTRRWPMVSGRFDYQLVACFAHSDIAQRADLDALRELFHESPDRLRQAVINRDQASLRLDGNAPPIRLLQPTLRGLGDRPREGIADRTVIIEEAVETQVWSWLTDLGKPFACRIHARGVQATAKVGNRSLWWILNKTHPDRR